MATRREAYNPLLKSYPDSEKVNAVTIGAETLFTRLIARCDDHSHYYADPHMVLGKLYTHRMCNGEVKVEDIAGWLKELAAVELITTYEVDSRRYLEVVNCKKSLRGDVLPDVQFPDPPGEETSIPDEATPDVAVTHAGRTRAESVTDTGRVRDENVSPTQPNPTQPIYAPGPDADGPKPAQATSDLQGFDRFWSQYRGPRKKAQEKCRSLWRSRKLEPKTEEILAALARYNASHDWTKDNGQYIPAPHRWLNEEYWKAAPPPEASPPDIPNPDTFVRAPYTQELAELVGGPWPPPATSNGHPVGVEASA